MSAAGNGARYKLTLSADLAAKIKAIGNQLRQAGRGKEFDDALRTIDRRLRTDPLGFGELVRTRSNVKLVEHVRIVGPLLIRFGIHTEKPIVFLVAVSLYS